MSTTTVKCPSGPSSDAALAYWFHRRNGCCVHPGDPIALVESAGGFEHVVVDIDGLIERLLVQGGEHVDPDEPISTVRSVAPTTPDR